MVKIRTPNNTGIPDCRNRGLFFTIDKNSCVPEFLFVLTINVGLVA